MNIKELLNIAAETGKDLPLDRYGVMFSHEQLLRFADKLTAIEREACAKDVSNALYGQVGCGKAIEAIRAKGQG